MKIDVNFHSSILINDEIYFDPLRVDGKVKAKYIFITHPHWDHFSVEDIQKIVTEQTKFVCPKSMEKELRKNFSNAALFVEPYNSYKIDNLTFVTTAAYNKNKAFHLKESLWVGYILEIENERVAVLGDSDITAELEGIKTDILLLPIGGYYTMNFEEGASLTNKISPKLVIPTHYGEIVGNKKMGEMFKELLDKNIKCELKI